MSIGESGIKIGDMISLNQWRAWSWDLEHDMRSKSLPYGQHAVVLGAEDAGIINGVPKHTLTLLTVPGCEVVESTAHWHTWKEAWSVVSR